MKPRKPVRRQRSNPAGRKITFEIESMDTMGQGVAHIDGKPCFIAKTLPGETGTATIFRASKGVQFARLETLEQRAENRVEPACEHFERCPGCHFLHTDYQSELTYKTDALAGHLKRLDRALPNVEVHGAEQRLHYRNRVQLHYRHKYIGMLDPVADTVLPVPGCQIVDEQLKPVMDALYQQPEWTEQHSGKGHCEIYLTGDGVSTAWDSPYAHGGFTQVNGAMNEVLRNTVLAQFGDRNSGKLLDLFSGEGNLSELIVERQPAVDRVMVDFASERVKEQTLSFLHLDLFSETALRTFRARSPHSKFDVLLLDPPRKGFPALHEWVKALKPKKLIYVSCNAATLVRDLQLLGSQCRIEHISLIDLFPGTYHYETLVTVTFP